jgi:hypothetical protein
MCRFHAFLIGKACRVQVWDVDAKELCYVHPFEKGITAFSMLQKSFYLWVIVVTGYRVYEFQCI